MRGSLLPLTVLAGLALGGCAQQTSGSATFTGAEKPVAQVVSDLSDDAQRGKEADVCSKVLSKRLVKAIAGDTSCVSEVKKAFEDADAVKIEVDEVSVTGDTATAGVHTTDRGKDVKRVFKLVREDGAWRIDSFG
jgi:hypothetical protein